MHDTQQGIVLENQGNFAKVKIIANSQCDNCGACKSSEMIVTAENKINAQPGSKVKITVSNSGMLKISFMLFFFPLISVFAGIYLGKLISELLQTNQIVFSFIGASLFLTISVVLLIIYDRKFKLSKSNCSVIIELIE